MRTEQTAVRPVKVRSENLQLIRFLAAVGVMICHSFSIAEGNMDREWLCIWTGGQLNFGLVSVAVFFIAGGFLITASAERSKSAGSFFRARALRIFPPLMAVTVSVMLAGVFFTELTPLAYFTSPQLWLYLLNAIFIPVHNLPGVFRHNPFLPTVNGSLWTLPVEFACYAACYVMVRLGFTEKRKYACTIPAACVFYIFIRWVGRRVPLLENLLIPCYFFYIGIGYHVFRDRIHLRGWHAAAALALIFLTCLLGIGKTGLLIGLPCLLMTVSFYQKQIPKWLGWPGNSSYGMYLWGFPVQQAVQSCMPGTHDPVRNLAFSVPIAFLLGMATYYLVEKRVSEGAKKNRSL